LKRGGVRLLRKKSKIQTLGREAGNGRTRSTTAGGGDGISTLGKRRKAGRKFARIQE